MDAQLFLKKLVGDYFVRDCYV